MAQWKCMNVAVGEALAEITSVALTPEQQGRLAAGWMRVYLGGDKSEEGWRIALGYGVEDWGLARGAYLSVLRVVEGGYTLRFMALEWERQEAVAAEQARKGRLRWEPNGAVASRNEPRLGSASRIEPWLAVASPAYGVTTEPEPTPPRKPSARAKPSRVDLISLELPDTISRDVWVEFVEHREAMGAKGRLTPRAAKLAIAELSALAEAGHSPKRVVERTILNGWKGLFPLGEKEVRKNGSADGW